MRSTKVSKSSNQDLTPAQIEKIMNLQNELLQSIILLTHPQQILNNLCRMAEHLLPNAVASIMLLDIDKQGLHVFAAPSIPPSAIQALNGLHPGPQAGSCGTAVYLQQPVFVKNTLEDKRWVNLKQIAYDFNICACWSMPVLNEKGEAIGSFALSSFESRAPAPFHRKILDTCAFLVGIILQRKKQQDLLDQRNQLTEEINVELQLTLEIANQAKQEAERANHAKSIFLTGISHELRTPLNSILGYTQVLKTDATLHAKQVDKVDIIYNSGKHLLNLINDILDISKIESGQMYLHPHEFDFQRFLYELSTLFEMRAQQQNIQYVVHIAADLPQFIYVDDTRLRQILFNLLDNAFKFTQDGEVHFYVGLTPQGKLSFRIVDQGIGIESEFFEKIFSPFQQLGNVLQKTEGTGLGLSITKNLVELMSGELYLNSQIGQGSEFSIILPLVIANNTCKQSKNNIISGYHTEDSQMYRILIVDDDKESQRLLSALLSPLGFEMASCDNGVEALQKIQTWRPDLIFMDLMMPVMDGLTAIARIKQQPDNQDIPIIAISASVHDSYQKDSLIAGCQLFIGKPFTLVQITDAIAQCLALKWDYLPFESEKKSALQAHDAILNAAQAQALYDLLEMGDRQALQNYLLKIQAHLDNTHFSYLEQLIKSFDDDALYKLLNMSRRNT